jgi:streptogramin lyase
VSGQGTITVSQNVMPTVFLAGSGSIGSLYESGTVQANAVTGGGIGVAVDPAGDVWSINANGSGVTRFTDANGVDSSFAGVSGVTSATSLAIDGAGAVWIANGSGMVSRFSNAGAAVSSTKGSTSSAGTGVAIDISGNVWVSNGAASSVDEVIGGATPVLPLATAVQNGTPAAKP